MILSADPQNRGPYLSLDYRTNNYNTGEVNRDRPSPPYPVISVSALLKLAKWYQDHSTTYEGGERCTNPQKERHPPANNQATGHINGATPLGDITGSDSSTDIAAVEPDGASATSTSTGQGGG
jgi:hypothetical protein